MKRKTVIIFTLFVMVISMAALVAVAHGSAPDVVTIDKAQARNHRSSSPTKRTLKPTTARSAITQPKGRTLRKVVSSATVRTPTRPIPRFPAPRRTPSTSSAGAATRNRPRARPSAPIVTRKNNEFFHQQYGTKKPASRRAFLYSKS